MKIKKTRLLQIIQEEIARIDEEKGDSMEALAAKAKENPNSPAMEELLTRLSKKHRFLALKLAGGNEADAEDAMQSALIKIMTQIGGFRGDSAFSTWAGAIMKNKLIDSFRAGRKELPFAGGGAAEGEPDITSMSDKSEIYPLVPKIKNPEQILLDKERNEAFDAMVQAIEDDKVNLNDRQKIVTLNQFAAEPKSVEELRVELGYNTVGEVGREISRSRERIDRWLHSPGDEGVKKTLRIAFAGGVKPGDIREGETAKPEMGLDYLNDLFSDMFKEIHNVRPGFRFRSEKEAESAIDDLMNYEDAEYQGMPEDPDADLMEPGIDLDYELPKRGSMAGSSPNPTPATATRRGSMFPRRPDERYRKNEELSLEETIAAVVKETLGL